MSIEKPSTGLFSAAGAALLAMLAYGNAVGGQFVYDDHFQVLRNPTLASLSNLPALFGQSVWQFMSASPDQPLGLYYRPLFNAALLLEYQVFGTRVFGWHVVSISLHALTTLLVYALGRAWRLSVAAAALGAALFAVHPVHCESVAWISGLPDLLAAVGLLGDGDRLRTRLPQRSAARVDRGRRVARRGAAQQRGRGCVSALHPGP